MNTYELMLIVFLGLVMLWLAGKLWWASRWGKTTVVKIWFAVDKDGTEGWFWDRPHLHENRDEWISDGLNGILFPGAIKLLTGKDIKWGDLPVFYRFKIKA